ncbi:major facilitator superfamily transporter [Komagataeibacter nataicola NRIC 0616]|nr:major facilitator superfamily transporter [Komagataeibacter nataicola NRIC 0616]
MQMETDLGFSDATFGLGAGLFFVGYIVFQVPASIVLKRLGARRTIAGIMIAWGVISFMFAFVNRAGVFCALRVLLGIAEAGFFPSVLFYLGIWFPQRMLGRVTSWFLVAIPFSGAIGGPISALILERMSHSTYMAGWKWMFLIEALPPILFGVIVLARLDDGPQTARWLTPAQRDEIVSALRPSNTGSMPADNGIFSVLRQRVVRIMIVICFCQAVCNYGIVFWIPTLVAQVVHTTPATIGFYTAIPFLASIAVMTLNAWSSDRHAERRWHLAIPLATVAASLVAGFFLQSYGLVALCLLSVALAATLCVTSMIFTLPGLFLRESELGSGLAWINSLGALGGLLGPYGIGWMRDHLANPMAGLLLVAACALMGAAVTLLLPVHRN